MSISLIFPPWDASGVFWKTQSQLEKETYNLLSKAAQYSRKTAPLTEKTTSSLAPAYF